MVLFAATAGAQQTGEIAIEGGSLWTGRADVRIPGDEGTRFSFTSDLDTERTAYFRARATWRPAQRHSLALTAAPLKVKASGTLPRDTRFVDTVFEEDTHVNAVYRFNNYRLTYRYRLWETERFHADFGATLFVRDAEISLDSGTQREADDDLGLVPLFSFRLARELVPGFAVVLDGDALAAPQGRAVDALCALQYEVRERLRLNIGYRILEGGADNDQVYTFALFHHFAAAVEWQF